jgi:hypothetical protein
MEPPIGGNAHDLSEIDSDDHTRNVLWESLSGEQASLAQHQSNTLRSAQFVRILTGAGMGSPASWSNICQQEFHAARRFPFSMYFSECAGYPLTNQARAPKSSQSFMPQYRRPDCRGILILMSVTLFFTSNKVAVKNDPLLVSTYLF